MSEEIFTIKNILDPKFPLLETFRTSAPGSHKHSQNVASLCEAVALELELDTDLMKAAGLYHDVGKMNSSDLFSENQTGKNPHDDLQPEISYHLITRHVGDTTLMLLQIPDFEEKVKLMQIVSQHHGNSVLRFFYQKAKPVEEDLFRYRCLPPQTIEAAVLMICDSVEATARALDSNDSLEETKDRRSVVNVTVERLTNDKQLEEIKVGEIRRIKSVLFKEMENMYHKREVYGDETKDTSDDESIKIGDDE
jgi:putative nucleotidyltransferase with HDIG domain